MKRKKEIIRPELNSYRELFNLMLNQPDAVACSYKQYRVTYKELFNEVHAAYEGFKKLGLQKNDNIMICLPDCPQAVECFYAADKAGLYPYTLHEETSGPAIEIIAEEKNIQAIITTGKNYEKVAKGIAGIDHPIKIILVDPKANTTKNRRVLKKKIKWKRLLENSPDQFVTNWSELKRNK